MNPPPALPVHSLHIPPSTNLPHLNTIPVSPLPFHSTPPPSTSASSMSNRPILTRMNPDPQPYWSFTDFSAGALVGTLGTWFLFRGTPIFNSYLKSNKRMVHVVFPAAIAAGSLTCWTRSNLDQKLRFDHWGGFQRTEVYRPLLIREGLRERMDGLAARMNPGLSAAQAEADPQQQQQQQQQQGSSI